MTLEEAKAILAPIREAERVVLAAEAAKEREEALERCERGEHWWHRVNSNVLRPYCRHCGKEKR